MANQQIDPPMPPKIGPGWFVDWCKEFTDWCVSQRPLEGDDSITITDAPGQGKAIRANTTQLNVIKTYDVVEDGRLATYNLYGVKVS